MIIVFCKLEMLFLHLTCLFCKPIFLLSSETHIWSIFVASNSLQIDQSGQIFQKENQNTKDFEHRIVNFIRNQLHHFNAHSFLQKNKQFLANSNQQNRRHPCRHIPTSEKGGPISTNKTKQFLSNCKKQNICTFLANFNKQTDMEPKCVLNLL